ncbi:hypothetical protein NC653_013572 [Populus alba x Populus x berolinensis]|uniref:Uncharacterized protein n=1 Tax=Populus alba x Populus x berolinensis TaxID=444605 RepID=A0AAD6W2P8_9ROSI|nr:hypothetical protein NC653_013572 [Populus alba x Populus x berolinensis]
MTGGLAFDVTLLRQTNSQNSRKLTMMVGVSHTLRTKVRKYNIHATRTNQNQIQSAVPKFTWITKQQRTQFHVLHVLANRIMSALVQVPSRD